MAGYNRGQKHFNLIGVDLAHPVDRLDDGFYPIIENVRSVSFGSIQPRPGTTAIGDAITNQTPLHTIRTLEDEITGSRLYTRILGAGTKLAHGTSSPFTNAQYNGSDVAFSGDPLSPVPYRPIKSPEPWLYLGDRTAAYKIRRASGTVHRIGLPSPTMPPNELTLYGANYKEVEDFEYANTAALQAAWATVTGVGVAPTLVARLAGPTVTRYVWDSANEIWACVQPSAMTGIKKGCALEITGESNVIVHSVHRQSTAVTGCTVTADAGAVPGMASIGVDTDIPEIDMDALISVVSAAGTEYARVRAVIRGQDGSMCIRAYLTLAHNTGVTITGLASFRAYFSAATGTHAAGDTISSSVMQSVFSGAGTGSIARTVALDLSTFSATLQATPDDMMHISLRVSDPSLVTEFRVKLDIDAATNNFTKNYYMMAIRQNDLTPAIEGDESLDEARRRAAQRRFLDWKTKKQVLSTQWETGGSSLPGPWEDYADEVPEPPPFDDIPDNPQQGTGVDQWTELVWRLGDMEKVGGDETRNFQHVAAIAIEATVTAAVTIQVDAWWIGGGYNPDVEPIGIPYNYRYRYRCSATGVVSNFSPWTLGGIDPHRQRVLVNFATLVNLPEVDKVDIERFGGTMTGPRIVGEVKASTGVFTDNVTDLYAERNGAGGDDNWQPVPVIGPPVSGTITTRRGINVTGLTAMAIGTYAPGTVIRFADGLISQVYQVLSSTSVLLTVGGKNQGAIAYSVPEPVYVNSSIVAGPSPTVLFGPVDETVFALGDKYNPGTLYVLNRNNPDAHTFGNRVEITPPSEPLMNGCMYDGRGYVWSTKRMFALWPDGAGGWRAVEVPGGRGLFARWALAVGPVMAWLGDDGIYASNGGAAISLTHERLRPLFPRGGQQGLTTNGFYAPDMNVANFSGDKTNGRHLRLAFAGGDLWFLYIDSNSSRRVLRYTLSLPNPGWHPETYANGPAIVADDEKISETDIFFGGTNATTAKLYQIGGTDDAGTAIVCKVRTPSENFGDPRSQKQFGDATIDYDPDADTIAVTPGFDNHTVTVASTNLSAAGGRKISTPIDLSSGKGQYAKNISMEFGFTVSTEEPILYGWEPSYIPRPEDTILRATDWEDEGTPEPKHVRRIRIHADTDGVDRTVTFQIDGTDATVFTLTINHADKTWKEYAVPAANQPLVCYTYRLLPTDSDAWKLYGATLEFDPWPDLSDTPTPWSDLGYPGAKWIPGLDLDADTANVAVDFDIEMDHAVVARTITATHNKRGVTDHGWEPFVAHLVRINPKANARVFTEKHGGLTRFHWEPHPENAKHWETQDTTHGLKGFQHIGYIELMVQSSADVVLTITIDGTDYTATLATSGGVPRKYQLLFQAVKGRVFRYQFVSASDFRLFKKDCEVHVMPWGAEEYVRLNPFGGPSVADGVTI